MIEIVRASETAIPVIEGILTDAVRWLESIGKPLWREEDVRWERLAKDFNAEDFYLAFIDGEAASCMAMVDYDPLFWPDVEKGDSLFIHKLAVKRFAAGKGVSDAMIAYAKSECMNGGIASLRLDCHSLMPKLRAVYERNGFECVAEKIVAGRFHVAFYKCDVHDVKHLYHYFDRNKPPLRSLTSLPFAEATAILKELQYADLKSTNPHIEWFMTRRYEMEKTVREKFVSLGGKPVNSAPVYFTLGANEGLKTWFDDPAWIRIPMSEFDPNTVSFTYGDTFAVFNPALDTGEEWWGRVYRYDRILELINRFGFPKDPPYDMKNWIFPKDKPIINI